MKLNKKSGAKIAIAVAVLMASGAPLAGVANAEAGKVHCQGVNACKGKSACKTAANDCAGMNACKGKGWVSMTAAECKEAGGTAG
jgi:hypothetical protein